MRYFILFVVGLVAMLGLVAVCVNLVMDTRCDDVNSINPTFDPSEFELKTILTTAKFGTFYRNFQEGRLGYVEGDCVMTNCRLTYNESAVEDFNFDAIIFDMASFNDTWRWRSRKPHQLYILYAGEPPGINGMPDELDKYDGFFNRTMTYLSDSDFPYPYGLIEPMASAPKTPAQRLWMMRNVLRPDYNPAKGKSKIAVWMAYNCNVPSNRQEYVHLLQQYVSVDIISHEEKCGGSDACPFSHHYGNAQDECRDMIEQTYKFYLSFENSICDEYVTEKFYHYMARNIVPVVLGGANYSAIAPPHSYIDALDFTPKQLAKYLLELDQNDALYAEYFWWKPHYRVANSIALSSTALCALCEALHRPIERKSITGLQDWFVTQRRCVHRPVFLSS